MKKPDWLTYNIDTIFLRGDCKIVVMWLIGFVLIYLAVKKEYEPTLLLPMGFGAIVRCVSGIFDVW